MTDRSDGDAEIMKAFWNEKALENPLYYISSFRGYDDQDPDEFWSWGRRLADRYLRESGIAFTGKETVLDLGCGIGRLTAAFAERFARVHGLDVSEEMIRLGRGHLDRFDNVSFEVGNGRDLSNYPDRTFDLVFSYITFQHIPDPVLTLAYIREAGRVLRPGGHFYFQVNNARPPGPWGRLRTRAGRLLRRAAGGGKRDASGGRTRKGGAGPVDKSGPRGLDSPAWVGSRVGVEEIRRACAQGGMDVETLRGEGTQYLWVRARRKRAAAGSTS